MFGGAPYQCQQVQDIGITTVRKVAQQSLENASAWESVIPDT